MRRLGFIKASSSTEISWTSRHKAWTEWVVEDKQYVWIMGKSHWAGVKEPHINTFMDDNGLPSSGCSKSCDRNIHLPSRADYSKTQTSIGNDYQLYVINWIEEIQIIKHVIIHMRNLYKDSQVFSIVFSYQITLFMPNILHWQTLYVLFRFLWLDAYDGC